MKKTLDQNIHNLKVGDKVKIVKYGAEMYGHKKSPNFKELTHKYPTIQEDKDKVMFDVLSEIVGKVGTIVKISGGKYALNGIPKKYAWYNRDQLEKV